jgi:hypothetical protein
MIVDDPRFHLERPVKGLVRTNGTTEKVASLFHGLDNAEMGYGVQLHLEKDGRSLRTHPYCGCESGSCPWCSSHLDSEDWEGSAHAFLNANDVWAAQGFVAGHGAPNLWYRNAATGVDARLWWYKYIGRSMDAVITGPTRHLHLVIDEARALVVDHIGGLLPNLWRDG